MAASAGGSSASKTARCPSPRRATSRTPADPQLYVKAVHDSIGMFNGDGVLKADGAQNVLQLLSLFSPNVKGRKDQIDRSKTYTTAYVAKVAP